MGLLRDSSKKGQMSSNLRPRQCRTFPFWGEIEDILDGEWLGAENGCHTSVKGLDTGCKPFKGLLKAYKTPLTTL
jgi:hypothetical protein